MRVNDAIERYLGAAGVSEATVRAYRNDLRDFAEWYGERPIEEVNIRALSDYTADLGRARRGTKLAPSTIARRLSAVRSLLRFTLGPSHVPDIPLAPRRTRHLPNAPKLREVEELLTAAGAGDDALSLRNRALLELLYSAGLRSSEAVGLDLGDVNFEQEIVHVRNGKGAKDRVVPLGEEAGDWVARYLAEARPKLARGKTKVWVLNGNGRSGAAASEAGRLHSAGYLVRGTANAKRTDYATTVVMYRSAYRGDALRLAHVLGVKVVGPLDGLSPAALHGAQLVILLGAR